MATPVGWSYGPWSRGQTSASTPYADVPSAAEVVPGATAGQIRSLMGDDAGGGWGGLGRGAGYAGETGPLSNTARSAFGGVSMGMRGLGALGAFAGAPAMGALGPATAPLGMAMVASRIASALGAQPSWGFEVPDYQSIADYQGPEASRAYGQKTAADWSGLVDTVNAATTQAQAESWGGGSGGTGPGDGRTGGGEMGGGLSGGGEYAKGGVSRVHKPTRALYGEGGEPETAVFVPQSMQRPGQQPREADVERTMRELLRALRG